MAIYADGFFLDRVWRTAAGDEGQLVTILEDVTAHFPGGAITALVGPSGSGKSSLLRLLNRLDEPSRGRLYWQGKPLERYPVRELRRQVGMLFQTPVLFPGTVEENLLYGPRVTRSAPRVEPAELLEQVGLDGEFLRREVSGLSGGQAQRVALARALANRPAALLLDEPTSALDPEARDEIELLITRLQRENALTVVWVTHDAAQALRVAQVLAVMQKGRLTACGPKEDLMRGEVDPWVRQFFQEGRYPPQGCCRPEKR
ncbi:ABC transporter ATP-binding protein [Desulfofundulus thermosubterraneus]|uniref:Putative ABC transport system ATP-binding protein n=1 Tax=Desulfofundulus thermosubterraneus DSM 16057 TaxID=1121432 RepID=A0A1M6AI33_9FIRM|nr:phosphate ABC transporter ATP-binding protein [Desulfofundulus thermosubterraneus]SHI36160.1 putative ABC transport system ATP-binding protein [Desulfofundulus thermosubterraneus DSM 16057]